MDRQTKTRPQVVADEPPGFCVPDPAKNMAGASPFETLRPLRCDRR
jgi:hypothetical protein